MKITKKKAKAIGKRLQINWEKIPFMEFHKGINVELEHGSKLGKKTNVTGDSPLKTGRIALAHLEEDPRYYTKLSKIENGKREKKLKEAIELIIESLIDEEFDIEELKRLSKSGAGEEGQSPTSSQTSPEVSDEFHQMHVGNILKYAEKELEYINRGNARQVFAMPDGESVLKIAYQSDRVKESDLGIKQNKKEVEISERESDNPLLAKVLDYDEDGYKWIISERVTPIDANSDAFSEATGIPEDLFVEGLKEVEKDSQINTGEKLIDAYINSLRREIKDFKERERVIRSNPRSGLNPDSLAQARSKREDMLKQYESIDLEDSGYQEIVAFLTNVIKLIRQHNLLIGDVARTEHWGFDKENKLKLYDYGAGA